MDKKRKTGDQVLNGVGADALGREVAQLSKKGRQKLSANSVLIPLFLEWHCTSRDFQVCGMLLQE